MLLHSRFRDSCMQVAELKGQVAALEAAHAELASALEAARAGAPAAGSLGEGAAASALPVLPEVGSPPYCKPFTSCLMAASNPIEYMSLTDRLISLVLPAGFPCKAAAWMCPA